MVSYEETIHKKKVLRKHLKLFVNNFKILSFNDFSRRFDDVGK